MNSIGKGWGRSKDKREFKLKMDVYKTFLKTASEYKDKPALVFEGDVITFLNALRYVNRIGNALKELGLKRREKLAIYLPNCPEYVFFYLATFGLGATVVPLDITAPREELINILKHVEASILIARANEALEIKNYVPSLKAVITNVDEIIKSDSEKKLPGRGSEEDIAVIIYTSGTTGRQKGVVLTYRHLDSPVMTLDYFGYLDKFNSILCPVPFSHEGGLVYILFHISNGSTLVINKRFIPSKFLRDIESYNVELTFVPPAMLEALLRSDEIDRVSLKSLKFLVFFGAPGRPTLLKEFVERFPHITGVTGWGLTESSAPNVIVPIDAPLEKRFKKGILGKHVPWIDIKIIDNKGNPLPNGQIGEILLKGWVIMKGYYNEPELTKEVLRDGWLYTGDLGYLDEDGYLYIAGRKKDVIITGGLNVYANEVEFIISEHPKVAEVAVVGVPDSLRGEVVKAVIVPKGNIKREEIISYCRKRLAGYKVPRIIEFRENLPKTASGKIKKAGLV